QYQNSQGALIQDQVGSVLYLDGKLTAADGSQLILDSQHTKTQVFDDTSTASALIKDGSTYWGKFGTEIKARKADLYLGQNTIMAVSDNILSQGAAIHFDKTDAAIMAQSVKDSSDAAKIVLDGNGFLDSRQVTLFTDNGNGTGNETKTGVKILGDQDIRVETLNGVMYFMLRAGEEISGGTLNLDTTKIDTAFLGATDVSRDLLFAYASQTANWDEYFAEANLDKLDSDETKVQREQLHGAAASSHLYTYDPTNSTNRFQLSQAAQDAGYQESDFVVIEHTDGEGKTTAEVYHRAYNDLLERIVRDTNGAAADGAALQGVFGGAAQAALLAARTSQDAVAGRTGVGATKSALTFADNGQGAGLWVAPIYVSQDSDGFAVSNKDYGVDIDLYGVALGGDYTLSNGLRVGAFFNVGSGDADGNGQAGGVSNDFDYYGVGLYAGYTLGQFSLVGDVSYTVVDSDIDAATQVGSIKSSFDTDNISVGVTGQYEFVLGGAQITPHAGLRYSALSFDDSTFAAGGYDNGGHSELDDVNVFSIPVGVTVAKEFAFDTWTVKPSFDVTLQGNFGDDELDSNAQWDGVAWQSTYTAEFLDNFTYGATLGVAAKTGSFSAGLGLGYTGSVNTDEFSATANARFTF
ncbi:MAG TPA: autotransporter outer membrane beta-barrel domain-containing protein, partial [Candidatus Anaerobiospirillum stercoravium]|nr:autotransporter outer membrane beta-barrel domain-containing protein [Candidatus Anaerobiospirillum stercoravium]